MRAGMLRHPPRRVKPQLDEGGGRLRAPKMERSGKGMEQNPEESIKAAVKYIAATANSFRRIPDPDERIKFILAAYNAGIGHITDAMALAEKYGKNKYIWDNNVADYILLKSSEEYFNDPLCKNGYFRGVETFKFVKEVISRGEVYKSKIKH